MNNDRLEEIREHVETPDLDELGHRRAARDGKYLKEVLAEVDRLLIENAALREGRARYPEGK